MNGVNLRWFIGTTASLFIFLFFCWTGSAHAQQVPAVQPEIPSLSDRNQSGIADDLERKLENAPANGSFDVVVTFRLPGGLSIAQQAIGGFEVKREFQIISGFAASLTAGQIRGLAQAPAILRIEEDVEVTAQMDAARRDFGVEAAWSRFGVNGAGAVICVVDTGVDPNHEQLNSKSLVFFDAVGGLRTPYDDNGHGTHVAAIAAGDGIGGVNAAAFQGVAPAADVYAAKVLDSLGSGSLSQVIAGVEWCAGMPEVDILNLSLGTSGGSDGGDSLSQAVNAAVQNDGKIVVVAAGNAGDAAETVGSPGAAEYAITVGAAAEWSGPVGTNRHSMGVYVAAFSSRGPTLDGRLKPDVVAPGHTIRSAQNGTTNGYVTFSGTSMASPFVAGAVALALNANPGLTPAQAKALLAATAQHRGAEGSNADWGAGLVDVAELVAGALGLAGDEPTAFPSYQRILGNVADNGQWNYSFQVGADDLHIPIGAAVTIEGELSCSLFLLGFCWAWEWSPDLDARLMDPGGNVLFTSECPAFGECAGVGRQETLRAMPTTAGQYTIEVWPYSGSPNDGKGGSFALDLSTGPLAEVASPEPEPEPDDNPPSAAIVAPADGSTVSGIVTVQVDAADDVDDSGTLDVEVSIGGGLWAPAPFNASTGLYEYQWDSDFFAGSSVQIDARATDSKSQTTNAAPVTVTVSEPAPADNPPTVSIVAPPDGSTVSGMVLVQVDASDGEDAPGSLDVEVAFNGGALQAAPFNSSSGHYELSWDSDPFAGNSVQIEARAADSAGNTANAAPIHVQVSEPEPDPDPEPQSLHVESLTGSSASQGRNNWRATVQILVVDDLGQAVSGATVQGNWSAGGGRNFQCTTDGSGLCSITSGNISSQTSSVTFTVQDVVHSSLAYDPNDNAMTEVTVAAP
ncbi:MAG TPA: S8 family serine peptidase [Acidobacteriota bacterium]|nr:S8 family serine peptidase [Acidobacteriota bacterium]